MHNEDPLIVQNIIKALTSIVTHIIIIDDGSNTAVTSENENVTLLRHRTNLGQGAALETGMAYARSRPFDAIIHMDADGQHRVEDIQHLLLPLLQDEADIIFGSRFLTPAHIVNIPFARRKLLQIAIIANYLFTGVKMSDAHNGFRALNRKALNVISLRSSGRAHASEIVWQAARKNLRIKEVPVNILYPDSHDKISAWELILLAFQLLWKRLTGYTFHSQRIVTERNRTLSEAVKDEQVFYE